MVLKLEKIMPSLKNNIVLFLLIAGAIMNDLIVRTLTVGNAFHWKPVITTLAMILLISVFTLFLSYKNRNRVYVILSIYFSLLSGLNYIYYQHYKSFMSISLLNQLKQVKEVGDSVTKTLDLKMLIFIVPTIILILMIRKLNKRQFFKELENKSYKKDFIKLLFWAIILLSGVSLTLTSSDWSRLSKQWNKPYLVETLGIYSYSMADLVKNLSSDNISSYKSEEAYDKLEDFVDENSVSKKNNKYTDIFKGKDVFVIHYESAQTFPMDLEFEDGEVTPFLNKFASEGLYFNNFYPQHSVGTSSDSEFTFNTSLLPINNGTVFLTHFDREYVTLPKLLKEQGYYTFSMHGNNGDFWNRKIMHNSLGYDRFFHEEDYVIDETIGLGLSDVSFYKQSIQKIKEIKEVQNKPVMATLITLTNHYPFADVDNYGEFNVGHLEGTDIGNYFKSFHYADMALKTLIEGMDKEGLLDNAIVVLYGDHHAKISSDDYRTLYNYDESTGTYYDEENDNYYDINEVASKELKRTPFIIWSKDKKINKTINTPMGMLDALPTLANMLGIYNPYQLGHDMADIKKNTIIFTNGDWLDSKSYYSASSSEVYNLKDNTVNIEYDMVNLNTKVENTIELSNSIIQHDLIRFFNNSYANNKLSPERLLLNHKKL